MPAYDRSKLQYRGLVFDVAKHYDEDHQAPWIEHDGHGVVAKVKLAEHDAPAGARELHCDRGDWLYYDWTASLARARAEEWGLGDADRAALAVQLGRTPTAEDVTTEAVRRDYEYLRGWCRDEWHYCGIVVTLHGTDISRSLWGIESSEEKYHEEVARELADEIIAEAATELQAEVQRLTALETQLQAAKGVDDGR